MKQILNKAKIKFRKSRGLVKTEKLKNFKKKMKAADIPFLNEEPAKGMKGYTEGYIADIVIDKTALVRYLARGVENKIRMNKSVSTITVRGGSVTGVRVGWSNLKPKIVVCCAGAGTGRLLRFVDGVTLSEEESRKFGESSYVSTILAVKGPTDIMPQTPSICFEPDCHFSVGASDLRNGTTTLLCTLRPTAPDKSHL